jgi:hypothetical protein
MCMLLLDTFMINIFLLDYIIQKDTDLLVKINSI